MPISDETRRKIDAGKTLAEMWDGFASMTMPHVHPQSGQYTDMRVSFYSGAMCLFNWMMVQMDPGEEPTDADEARMTAMHDEIHAFMGRAENLTPRK